MRAQQHSTAQHTRMVRLQWKAGGHHASVQPRILPEYSFRLWLCVHNVVVNRFRIPTRSEALVSMYNSTHKHIQTAQTWCLLTFPSLNLANQALEPQHGITLVAEQAPWQMLPGTKCSVEYYRTRRCRWAPLASSSKKKPCHWAPTRVMIERRSGLDRWATVVTVLGVGLQFHGGLAPQRPPPLATRSLGGPQQTRTHLAPAGSERTGIVRPLAPLPPCAPAPPNKGCLFHAPGIFFSFFFFQIPVLLRIPRHLTSSTPDSRHLLSALKPVFCSQQAPSKSFTSSTITSRCFVLVLSPSNPSLAIFTITYRNLHPIFLLSLYEANSISI